MATGEKTYKRIRSGVSLLRRNITAVVQTCYGKRAKICFIMVKKRIRSNNFNTINLPCISPKFLGRGAGRELFSKSPAPQQNP